VQFKEHAVCVLLLYQVQQKFYISNLYVQFCKRNYTVSKFYTNFKLGRIFKSFEQTCITDYRVYVLGMIIRLICKILATEISFPNKQLACECTCNTQRPKDAVQEMDKVKMQFNNNTNSGNNSSV